MVIAIPCIFHWQNAKMYNSILKQNNYAHWLRVWKLAEKVLVFEGLGMQSLVRPSRGLGFPCTADECAVVQGVLIVSGSYLSVSMTPDVVELKCFFRLWQMLVELLNMFIASGPHHTAFCRKPTVVENLIHWVHGSNSPNSNLVFCVGCTHNLWKHC